MKLAVVRVPSAGGDAAAPTWMGLIDEEDATFLSPYYPTHPSKTEYYLARVGWWADGSVMAQVWQ